MEKKTLETLFMNKHFFIPDYQRDYAWQFKNVDDLFGDVRESIETRTGHYIGTFILSKVGSDVAESIVSGVLHGTAVDQTGPTEDAARKAAVANLYALVDGQQRLTTLSMILHTLVAALPSDDYDRVFYERQFLRSRSVPHLLLQKNNHDFYYRLLQSSDGAVPSTRGQRLLAKAYAIIKYNVQALVAKNGDQEIRHWLEAIKDLEVLEFIEEDEGRAIRIFQTVNDRGVSLMNMDRAKSLLVYYSNCFLHSKLDHKINECFGEAYRSYDAIKELAENKDYYVDLIASQKFNEDSILRWHFVSTKSDEHWTYDATAQYVLDMFLRPSLKDLRDKPEALAQFIEGYVTDVQNFFSSLRVTLERMKTEPEYYKLFALLGPSTYLYPLIVRLAQRGLLDLQTSPEQHCTFRSLLETADVRVYKTRGTDPQTDVAALARDLVDMPPQKIAATLRDIIKRFMSDAEFEARLRLDVYRNQALVRVLVGLDEHLLRARGEKPYTLEALIERKKAEPTIEHVFSQEPRFDFPGHQFQSAEEYADRIHKFGNLLVLEKRLNSRCNNRTAEEKISGSDLYAESTFECVQQFRQDCLVEGRFTVAELDKRTDAMVKFCLSEWPI
jgi:hypothetical protein